MFSDDDDDWNGSDDEDLDARYGIGASADNYDGGNDMFDTDQKISSTDDLSRSTPNAPKSPTPSDSYNLPAATRVQITPESAKGSSSGDIEYRVISTTDVLHEQNELIVSVSDVLQVPRSAALAMLLWSGWSKERLLEKYMGGDAAASKVCMEAGVMALVRTSRGAALPTVPSPGSLRCNICYKIFLGS